MPTLISLRGLSSSSVLRLKEIQHREEGNKIIVEVRIVMSSRSSTFMITLTLIQGIKVESPRKDKVVKCREGKSHCHPFCRSPIVGLVGSLKLDWLECSLLFQVKHTDVLILDQFVDSKGEMYRQDELGICKVIY